MSSIPIVIAFTPNYMIPAATTVLSILSSSEQSDKFVIICLLTEELSDEMKASLLSLDAERLSFKFLNLQDELKGVYVDERYTIAASYRLLLPNILTNYSKVIYTDCDIIVRNNIAQLYRTTDLGHNYLAAVYEATLEFQIPYIEKIGCEPREYINSGFLIMNLDQMRKDDIVPELIKKLDNPNSSFPDQDALNIVCKGKILGLNPIYNSIRTYFLPQYKADFLKYYTKQDWTNVQSHGTIHYTGVKPWNGYTVEFVQWWKYYEGLPDAIKVLGDENPKLLFYTKLLRIPIFGLFFRLTMHFYRLLLK